MWRVLSSIFGVLALPAAAATLSVQVLDNQGVPLPQAVVYATPLDTPRPDTPAAPAVMDQIDKQFVPHILVVQRGSEVAFPNSDSIKHHVYSFSPAKTFELRLYSGTDAAPVAFDQHGTVEMGCNIHDWMLGYVKVVDTPYFAKADRQGSVTLDIPAGRYQVNLWHPRIQDNEETLVRTLDVTDSSQWTHTLSEDLLRDLSGYEKTTETFNDY